LQIDAINRRLTREDRERFRETALKNAQELGLSGGQWERRRRIESLVIADVLMAFAPQLPPEMPADGPKAAARALGRLRIDDLATELRDARRYRDTTRLKQLLGELVYRKSKVAARLAASARLSLLAIEKPGVLPFRID